MSLKGACIFGQSGGPTSVINASAYGVFSEALKSPSITRVLGAAHGIKGVLNDCLYDIGQEDLAELELLKNTPSSALGSCRYKLKDEKDFQQILAVFQKHDVRYFFYNGGNDSMDTCSRISEYLSRNNYECMVIGVPKTIDNDLFGTDHCPGYGSAAKFIATSCAEIYQDAHVYDTGTITVIEAMGRHAGWLTAAASLAALSGCAPDLIYMPEVTFDLDQAIETMGRIYKEKGNCFTVISEGIHDKDGVFISEYAQKNVKKDAFGHAQLGGAAAYIANEVKVRTGAKTRGIEFSLMQRCAAHLASLTDIDEAVLLGREAVKAALSGISGKMTALERVASGKSYQAAVKLIDLQDVANYERKFPLEWIDAERAQIVGGFIDYALPLIQGEPDVAREQGMPRFARLKKVRAE